METATAQQTQSIETVAPVISAPTEGAAEQPKSEPQILESERFAALAKREQKNVHRELQLKKQEEELAAKQKELETKLTPFQEFEVLKSKDPVAALRGLGFSETDIFNWLADSEPKELTPEQKAEAAAQKKIDEFRKEQLEAAQKAQAERETEVLTRFRGRIKTFLSTNKDKYEACADQGSIAEEMAYRTIEQIAKDTGEVISLDEAFQALESYYDGEYERMSKYNKFKKATEVEQVIGSPKKEEPVSRGTKTITNAAAPTIASQVPKNETREQKRERLINQIKQTGLKGK
jgi:hypothetical protein